MKINHLNIISKNWFIFYGFISSILLYNLGILNGKITYLNDLNKNNEIKNEIKNQKGGKRKNNKKKYNKKK
jgi:hypothetical protein